LARHAKPDIFNPTRARSFTGVTLTGMLANGIAISMDGKGAWRDNVFVERLWRSVKYEEVYLRAYDSLSDARASIGLYFDFYKRSERSHLWVWRTRHASASLRRHHPQKPGVRISGRGHPGHNAALHAATKSAVYRRYPGREAGRARRDQKPLPWRFATRRRGGDGRNSANGCVPRGRPRRPQVRFITVSRWRGLFDILYLASIWVIPIIIAITFHEAAHGFVAHLFGDETAWRLGRVSFNPLKHVDPVGTILLPGFLLLVHSPFLFGYAKPVPVNFKALRNPRRDMIWVAAAGPTMNLALAILAALSFHLVGYLPGTAALWTAENLKNALVINVLLAVFNLFPLPPLDGGRIAVGVLPDAVASPLARLEPYGMLILVGLLFILPMLGAQVGIDVNILWRFIARSADALIDAILRLTGNYR
jgi:Zn-dependent protease